MQHQMTHQNVKTRMYTLANAIDLSWFALCMQNYCDRMHAYLRMVA